MNFWVELLQFLLGLGISAFLILFMIAIALTMKHIANSPDP